MGIYYTGEQSSAPSAPSAGYVALYFKSDGLMYWKDDAGTEYPVVYSGGTGLFGNGTVSAPSISFASDTNTGLYRIGADNLGVAVNGTKIIDVSTIGAGVTGVLTATGTVSGTRLIPTGSVQNTEASLAIFSSGPWLNTPSGTTGRLGVAGSAVAAWDSTGLSVTGSVSSSNPFIVTGTSLAAGSSVWFGSDTLGGGAINVPAGEVFLGLVNQAEVIRYSSTGLAVTGALSSTGNATLSTAAGVGLSVVGGTSSVTLRGHTGTNTDTLLESRGTGAVYLVAPGLGNVYANINSVNVGTFSSTGLSVTGALSATGGITTGNDVGGVSVSIPPDTGIRANAAGSIYIDGNGSGGHIYIRPHYISGTNVGDFSTSGLAITGALSCSTNLTVTGGTITTGSTTALSLATSGGTQAKFNNAASTVNWHNFFGSATGNPLTLVAAGETNVGFQLATKGTGVIQLYTGSTTDGGTGALEQVRITHTASANRYITLTGSNGGNPTIGTSAGNLAISSTILSANNIQVLGTLTQTNVTDGTDSITLKNQAGTTAGSIYVAGTSYMYIQTGASQGRLTLNAVNASAFISFETNNGFEQVRITPTASANRFVTITGSNGGNPTIGTSAGDLAISSALVLSQTTLLKTSVALTNGAAANAGTLLNAPAAGNPTKWIPIDDNGTTRYIPAW
jgi:hypothetical protein